ncbi:MAG: zf-TFIIB domain-containing protein [Planctomycetota bacterium]
MLIVEFDEIELDICPDCEGIWFDAQELHELFELVGVPEQIHDLEGHLERLERAGSRRSCPRCGGRIAPVKMPQGEGDLVLDRCPRGHGLWFDKGELETLFTSVLGEGSDALAHIRRYLGHFSVAGNPSNMEE